jgi:hypothetical protein
MMKRLTLILAAALVAGGFRPAMRHDCGRSMPDCAAVQTAPTCHKAPSCHKAAAPEKKECPGMACCLVQEDRAALAAVSVAPHVLEEGVVVPVVSVFETASPAGFSSSPSPPGDGASTQEGLLSSSSLRGPPVLA